MARKIKLSWPELGESVVAELFDERNPELCQEFWEVLPFTVPQAHPVVSGESIYAWTPLVSTAPVQFRLPIIECPVGTLRYSQSTGNKLSVQYGPGLEPLTQPILGQVQDADLAKLPRVGQAVWENLFWKKDLIFLTVERLGATNEATLHRVDGHLSAFAAELEAAAEAILITEPDELRNIRTGAVPDTGTYGQYFTAWDFANGMIRDYVMYTLYPLLRLADRYEPAVIADMYREFDPPYSSYLGYSGLAVLEHYAARVGKELAQATTRGEVKDLLAAFVKYGNRLCAWSYQYFPHYLGIFYRRQDVHQEFPGRWKPARQP